MSEHLGYCHRCGARLRLVEDIVARRRFVVCSSRRCPEGVGFMTIRGITR